VNLSFGTDEMRNSMNLIDPNQKYFGNAIWELQQRYMPSQSKKMWIFELLLGCPHI
jgi:hypothetical protein